jgi:murein L,D-transpeptidase YafK
MNERATRPLSDKMIAEIESKNMDKDSPILIRAFKQESELEVWKQDRTGRFALLKTYPICRWSGELGPKIKEGDRQAPEGFYTITPGQMNPNSQYYLSFNLGFPNAFDRAHGRTGAHPDGARRLLVARLLRDDRRADRGNLRARARLVLRRPEVVPGAGLSVPHDAAEHGPAPQQPAHAFWRMLKRGNDHFEVTRLEPKVSVCEKRYVFDAYAPGDPTRSPSFNPTGKCPAYEVPEEILVAVQDKQRRDEFQTAELTRRGVPTAPIRTNADGGMHPVFVAAVKRNELGVAPAAFSLASAPGTVPATVNPPRIPELADAPVMADRPVAAPTPRAAPVRTAAVQSATEEPPSGTRNLFGGLFSSNSADDNKTPTPIDRMARLIGLRGSDPEPATAANVPAPRPRPAIRQASTQPGAARPAAPSANNGAIRPRQSDNAEPARALAATPTQTAVAWPEPPAPPRAQPQPAPQAQASAQPRTQAAPPPANGSLRGAAPVVPSGSFENRWSAFR